MLQKGDKVSDFTSKNQHGNTLSLSDLLGKKTIVFFYPKASTPGCTKEACDLRENKERLKKLGYQIVGVSADTVEKQKKFADKYELDYPLLADVDKEVINLFGVWGPKKFMGKEYDGINRTTFLLDEKGIVEEVITKVKTKEHADQIIALKEA